MIKTTYATALPYALTSVSYNTRRGRAWVRLLIRSLLIDSVVAVLTPACLYLLLRQRLPPVVSFNSLLMLPLAHLLEPRLSKLDTGGHIRSEMVIAVSSESVPPLPGRGLAALSVVSWRG